MARPAEIPSAPAALTFAIAKQWDGAPPPRPELRARLRLGVSDDALQVEAWMPHQRPARVPDAPPGSRVDGLWEFDVVECFLVGGDGSYVELELGAGGHHLLLGFSAPRVHGRDFGGETLEVAWRSDAAGWTSRCALPRAWLPAPLVAANAFAIGGGHFLAHAPVGGAQPDFHRPDAYPTIRVPAWD
jgi:hypothetical protein